MPLPTQKHRLIALGLTALIAGGVFARIPKLYASSWSPTLLVNTEAFQVIDDTDSSADLYIQFGGSLNKRLTYDRTNGTFVFDDDLEVIGTASGQHLHAQDRLTSSGQTIIEGNQAYDPATLVVDQNVNGSGQLIDSESETQAGLLIDMPGMNYTNDNGQAVNPHILFGYNNMFDVNMYRQAADVLKTDDSFWVKGTVSGATIRGFNLTDCDNGTDDKLLWDATTGTFSCGTDQGSAGGSGFSGTGSLQDFFDNRYVEIGGDTMTGTLTIDNEGSEPSLNVRGTVSGAVLRGFDLTDCDNGTNSKLLWDATTGTFSCGTDTDTNTNQLTEFTLSGDSGSNQTISHGNTLEIAGGDEISTSAGATDTLTINITDDTVDFTELEDALDLDADTTLTFGGSLLTFITGSNPFKVVGALSGSTLHADNSLTSSGTLVAEGQADFNGDVNLGDATSDTVTFTGQVDSSIIPSTTNTYDLGSSTKRWRDIYLSGGTLNLGEDGDNATIGYDVSGDRLTFDPDGDGDYEIRMSDLGSLDLAELGITPATATGYVRLFAREGTAGGNDDNTVVLGDTETTSNLTNSAIGANSQYGFSGGCTGTSSAQAKFGSNSLDLDCSGYQVYRYSPGNGDIDFATGDFTVDTWVYEGSNTSADRWLMVYNAYNDVQWGILINSSNQLEAQVRRANGTTITLNDASTFSTAQWVHVALERDGNTFRLYKNGTAVDSATDSADLNAVSSAYLMLGNRYPYNASGDQNFTGYLDEPRISNVARYGGSYSVETSAYGEDNSGLYFRDGKGNVIQLQADSSDTVGSEIQNIWTLNDDATINYSFGNVGIASPDPETELEVVGTVSGATLHAQDHLSSSGSFALEGGFFQNGMTDCDTSSQALQWDASTGTFSCGSAGGLTQDAADARYVEIGGDTMTGALAINPDSDSTTMFQVNDANGGDPIFNVDTTNERVGIGTNSPLENLHVTGSAEFAGRKFFSGTGSTSGAGSVNGFNMTLNQEHGTSMHGEWHYLVSLTTMGTGTDTGAMYLLWYLESSDTWVARMISQIGNTSNHPLVTTSGNNAIAYTNHASGYVIRYSIEGIYVDEPDSRITALGPYSMWQKFNDDVYYIDGDVGIGTDTTQQGLHYEHDTPTFRISDENSANVNEATPQIELYDRNDANRMGQIGFTSTSDSHMELRNRTNANLEFWTNNSLQVTIENSGEVGIGTNTPETELEVIGTVSGSTVHAQDELRSSGSVIIDASVQPQLLGSVKDATKLNDAINVAVAGDYAYVVGQDGDSFQIIDISDKNSPSIVGGIIDTTNLAGATGIAVRGNYAYVTNTFNNSLRVIDITDPTDPTLVGGIQDSTNLNGAYGLVIDGAYAYIAGRSSSKVIVVDISNPLDPQVVGSVQDNTLFNSVRYLDVSGNYAYATSYLNDSVAVIDITDPSNPSIVGSLQDNTNLDGVWQIRVMDKYAYVTTISDDSMRIINIADPTNPTLAGGVKNSTLLNDARALQVAGKYAYVGSVIGDTLSIIDITDADNPSIEGYVTDATNLNAIRGVAVQGNEIYVATEGNTSLQIVSLGGLEAPSASIGSLETGWFSVVAESTFGGVVSFMRGVSLNAGFLATASSAIHTESGATLTLQNESASDPGLKISMNSAQNAIDSPHILFGYQNVFDTKLFRQGTGSLTVQSETGTTLRIDSEMTGDTNMLTLVSDDGGDENTKFRFQANGQAYADGNWNSLGADFAEWFPTADTGMESGDVACLDPKRPKHVKRCNGTSLQMVGIVSTNPGFVGNAKQSIDGKAVLIGMIGQVPVKVLGNIDIGDHITLSNTDGVGKKAGPYDQTVCMAMEPHTGGEVSSITCLLSRNGAASGTPPVNAQSVADYLMRNFRGSLSGKEF